MDEQWCPFAIVRIGAQGLDAKRGYPGGVQGLPDELKINAPKRGEVKHDSTGPLSATLGVLDNHPINSWHFTVDLEVYQHYPVDANCWHGNDTDPDQDVRANIELVGVEHTRVNGQMALHPRQLELTGQLSKWLMETRGRPLAYRFPGYGPPASNAWELCEHNEVGNTPTACPSGRIPWDEILRRLSMPERDWIRGDEQWGEERRGKQIFIWHRGVEIDAIGDYDGNFPGAHYHHAGDDPATKKPIWVEVLR